MIEKREKIHQRKIQVSIYQGDSPDSLVVEGVLEDRRLLEAYLPSGEARPPGKLHHMIIGLQLRRADMVIEDVEVEMPAVPHDACTQIRGCLEKIRHTAIVPGFSARVKEIAGGTRGCVHLIALLTAMAPAAFQGAWSAMVRRPVDPDVYLPMAVGKLKNTCWTWRDGGPLMKKYGDLAK